MQALQTTLNIIRIATLTVAPVVARIFFVSKSGQDLGSCARARIVALIRVTE